VCVCVCVCVCVSHEASSWCPLADGGVVKGRQCICASTHATSVCSNVPANATGTVCKMKSTYLQTGQVPRLDRIAHQAPPPLPHPL